MVVGSIPSVCSRALRKASPIVAGGAVGLTPLLASNPFETKHACIEPACALECRGIADGPACADVVWDAARKESLGKADGLLPVCVYICFAVGGRDCGKARIGEDQPRHLTHAENFFGGQKAVGCKDPTRLPRAVAETVPGVMDHVEMFIDNEHREIQRLAGFGIHDDALGVFRRCELRIGVPLLFRADSDRGLELIAAGPCLTRLVKNLYNCSAFSTRARQR